MTQHRGLVLAGILFAVILAGVDTIILSVVMPTIVADLGGEALVSWAFSAYMLTTAASMPMWGPGSDRWGRRRTYLASIVVFVAGSLLCAVAPTMPLFLLSRAVQGIGAGGLFSLPFIILAVVYPPERRGHALGIVSTAWALSSVAGPALGTLILTTLDWRFVFLVNVPSGALAAALVWMGMNETRAPTEGRFDVAGSVLAAAGASLLIWAFVNVGEGRLGLLEAALTLLGVAAFIGFVGVERRAEVPVLPLHLFRRPGFRSGVGAGALLHFIAFGLVAFLPFELDRLFGDPRITGFVITFFSVGWSLAGLASGRMVHRLGERALTLAGIGFVGVGLAALPFVLGGPLMTLVPAVALTGVGMGTLTPALTVSVQNSVEVARMGSATASQQFLRQIGAAVGVGAFGLAYHAFGFGAGVAVQLAVLAAGLAFALGLPASSLAPAGRRTGDAAEAPAAPSGPE